jgi:flagellar P-ring protein FlgI
MRIKERVSVYRPGWAELVAVLCFLVAMLVSKSEAARVKDVASLDGLGEVQLVGYGLVVGLNGTGDGTRTQFTVQSVANMLQKMGVVVPPEKLRLRNVAAVMVTGNLSAFMKPGKKIDVTISSLGDARSLEGGTLLMTPLQAADGEYYAQAQGPVSVGGIATGNKQKDRYNKGHTLAGSIPNGAMVHREVVSADLQTGTLRWVLSEPDFSSAVAMAAALNKLFPGSAKAEDAGSVAVTVPENQRGDYMAFIARAEVAEFAPATNARVILNEKTGTLVSGADVRISEVAVSHGSIVINVENTTEVSQPNTPRAGGQTQTVNNSQTTVQEAKPEMRVIPAVNNAGQLAQALNSLGVTPRDIIAIFQAIKKAGALHAELVIM